MEKIFEQIDNLFVNGVINGIISIVIAGIVLIAINKLLNKFIKNVGGIHRTLLQFFAAIIVAIFSSYVWLVHRYGKYRLDVSRLLCILTTPASLSFLN